MRNPGRTGRVTRQCSMEKTSIAEHFADLPDSRMDLTKRHSLADILTLTLCGAIYGVDNWVEMERFTQAK